MSASGVIIVNKEKGMTSHDVVAKIRKLFGTRQVGHTGTLDPIATGVLPVMVGSAVKASEYLTSEEKEYRAVLTLGITTDTKDITGKILSNSDDIPSDDKIKEAFLSFEGSYMQTPPMYSAIKVNGVKLYDLAREGVEVEREAREVKVEMLSYKKLCERDWEITVRVSKGTYIRSLIDDIGKKLGVGAVMSALERLCSGAFRIESSHTLSEIEAECDKDALLFPTESLFKELKSVSLPPFYERLARNGAEIYIKKAGLSPDLSLFERVRMTDGNGTFFALGEVREFERGLAVKPIKFFI